MLKIGAANWVRDLKEMTAPLGADFWSGFQSASEEQLRDAEKKLGRKLDPEFREFYRAIGYGEFPDYGQFDAPEEFPLEPASAIFFITGSMTPGEEWATLEEHMKLWLSRGRENPNPGKFTEEIMTLDEVKLYDLLQFGSNGCACYHYLYMGPEPAPVRYCLLSDSQTMEDRSGTFSEGLERILQFMMPGEEE